MSARPAHVWRQTLALLALLAAACSGGESNGTAPPPTLNAEPLVLRISPKADTLAVGATKAMSVTLTTAAGAPRSAPIAWSSADPSVASVADGKVTAVAYGRTTVHARAGSAADSALIVVTSDQLQLVVSPSAVSATAGDTIEFQVATLAGSGAFATTSGVTWHISDTTSAALSKGGALATRAQGEVTVTAVVGSSTASASVKISNAPIASIAISPSTSSLSVGDTTRLSATLYDSRGRAAKGTVSWSSSNPAIAKVDASGRVTAVATGGAVITAASSKTSASATVNVSSSPASSVTLAFADSLTVSRTLQATATAYDAAGAVVLGRPMAWQSSNPGVATVNTTGLVTGIAGGQSNLSVIVDGIVATRKLTVTAAVPTTVVISPSAVNVVVGASATLSAEVRDQYGNKLTGQAVSWTSDAPATASVSGGKVTGLALGGADIRANVGSLSARAAVSVQNIPVASVSVSPATASMEEGESVTLAVTAFDASGNVLANRPATFTSSAPQLATVNAAGEVTGIDAGSLTVTATIEGVTASSAITVTALPPVPVATITYTLNSNTLTAGQTTQGVARTYDASGNELFGRSVTFSSLNPSIASVASNGTVTALSGGTASLSAASEGKTGFTSITVNPSVAPVASVALSAARTSIAVGDTTSLIVVLKDASGNTLGGRTISYTTSDPSVISVSSDGLVTGIGAGSATVTATSGGVSGTIAFAVATGTTPLVPVSTVSVTLNASALTVGQGTQANVVLRDASNNVLTGRSVSWSSSNPAVATVSQSGYVIAAGAGSATISASSEGKSGSAVLSATAPVASVTTLSVALGLSTITVGQSTTATATARDAGGNVVTGSSVSWTVTPAGAATVASSTASTVTVSGNAAGTVSVVANVGGVTGSVSLTVKSLVATPISYAAVVRGIRPRGFGQGTYALRSPTGSGVARYVDAASGSDANPGTAAAPYKTVQKAATVAIAGDVVTILPGTYRGTVRVANSGTALDPIVFQAATRGAVVFSDTTATFQPAGWTGQPMYTTGQRYVTLRGLVFRDWGGNVRGQHGVRAITGWRIEDALLERAGYVGVQVEGNDVVIERSTLAEHFGMSVGAWAPWNPGLDVGDSIAIPFIRNLVLRDLILRGNARGGATLPTGGAIERSIKFLRTSGTRVENIEAFDNDGPGVWLDAQNRDWAVRDSYFHDNRGGSGYGIHTEINFGPGVVERNVFIDNAGPGVFVNSSQYTTIRENYFSGNRMCVMLVNEPARGYPMTDIRIAGNQCRDWKQHSAMHALGGTFTTPAAMRVTLDSNTYQPTLVPGLTWWNATLGGASTIAQMQGKFGWEMAGRMGQIAYPPSP